MKIDPTTLLFTEFTDEEARGMEAYARALVLGPTPPLHEEAWPSWVREWFRVAGFDTRQVLMVVSTVLPTRILLSLVSRTKDVFVAIVGTRPYEPMVFGAFSALVEWVVKEGFAPGPVDGGWVRELAEAVDSSNTAVIVEGAGWSVMVKRRQVL